MRPNLNDDTKKLLTSLTKSLGISYPTMRKYIDTGEFPGDICISVEKLTNGRVTCNQLNPELFEGLIPEAELAASCLDQFEKSMACQNYRLIISVLDFIEVRQPKLYRSMVEEIKSLEGGELFIAQRLAHRRNGND